MRRYSNLPCSKLFLDYYPNTNYCCRGTTTTHAKSRSIEDNESEIIQCLIFAQTRKANNGLHNLYFIWYPSSQISKKCPALPHYRNPRVLPAMSPTVPCLTVVAAPETTQPHYCKAYYSTVMYLYKLQPTLELFTVHTWVIHRYIDRLEIVKHVTLISGV